LKLLAGVVEVGDFIVNKCVGFITRSHWQYINGTGHFPTKIKSCNNEYSM